MGKHQFLGGPSSPAPVSSSPIAIASADPSHYYAKPTIELSSHDGTFLIAYPTCAQLWEFSSHVVTGGAYCIVGSTFGVNGKIISAHFINYEGNILDHVESDDSEESDGPEYSDGSLSDEETGEEPMSCHKSQHNSLNYVLLQVVKRNDIHLEVHQLNKKPSFVQTLVLPPASSGPGPYSIYTRHTEKCIAVITKAGAVTLFSVPDFNPMALSGLETALNAEGLPLFDLCGRWLVYSPTQITSQTAYTPVKLPPPGLLLDRILENISSTTASSLKSLSDASVAGLRHYLAKDSQAASTNSHQAKRTGNNVIFVGSNTFNLDASGRVGSANTPTMSSLPAALSSFFSTQHRSQPIQIIDLETQITVSTFLSPQGLSFLSLSPYDSVLATVSAKGENVFTFDLSFVPRQVSLSGKYVRGKTPAKVSHVEWDSKGGLGIITSDKGSVHWFERQPWNTYESQIGTLAVAGQSGVIPNSSKMWKLSGWNVSSMCMIPDAIGNESEFGSFREETLSPARKLSQASIATENSVHYVKQNKIAMLREGEIVVVDVASGSCSWKYDLPSSPIAETYLLPIFSVTADDCQPKPVQVHEAKKPVYRSLASQGNVEPLSFYEMETCLPYPFLHTDRHVILATYEASEEGGLVNGVFGMPIRTSELDFGRARGQVNFSGDVATPPEPESPVYYEVPEKELAPELTIPWEKAEELQHAMESMVITPEVKP